MSRVIYKFSVILVSFSVLASCAGTGSGPEASYASIDDTNDPLEPLNRAIFGFNEIVDRAILEPTARGYRFATPPGFRSAVSNVLSNLREPVNVINNFLSGNFAEAGDGVFRFIVNTTIGMGGLNDVASDFKLPEYRRDFGQTLSVWGVGEGPYVVLPLFGGHNMRDAVGVGVDIFANPIDWALFDSHYSFLYTAVPYAVSVRERNIELIDSMREDSLDFYVTYREFYRQNRRTKTGRGDDISAYNFDMDFDEEEEE